MYAYKCICTCAFQWNGLSTYWTTKLDKFPYCIYVLYRRGRACQRRFLIRGLDSHMHVTIFRRHLFSAKQRIFITLSLINLFLGSPEEGLSLQLVNIIKSISYFRLSFWNNMPDKVPIKLTNQHYFIYQLRKQPVFSLDVRV